MSDRATTTRIVDVNAACSVCDWADGGAGALGRAAQHHDRTGHEVNTEQTLHVRYGETPSPEALGQTVIDLGAPA